VSERHGTVRKTKREPKTQKPLDLPVFDSMVFCFMLYFCHQLQAKEGKRWQMSTAPKTIQVAARVPVEIKEQASAVASAYGLGLGDAVRMFVTRIAKEKRIPLDISRPLVPISNFDQSYPEYQNYIDAVAEEYLHE
jgi:addiction module RelB/DinJ family antitoxin